MASEWRASGKGHRLPSPALRRWQLTALGLRANVDAMTSTVVPPLRVVLMFGGRSAEHEISLLSARAVLKALDRKRFVPLLIGIDQQGRWHREAGYTLAGPNVDPRSIRLDPEAPMVDASVLRPDDVVFPVLHGTYGEDGTIQGLLDLAGVAYVGAPGLGSAVAMDEDVAKRLLRDAGIPAVPFH